MVVFIPKRKEKPQKGKRKEDNTKNNMEGKEMSEWEDEGSAIDWENPFDDIRSSEVESITFKFLDNGRKIVREDDKGEEYTQYNFKVLRTDISNPAEVKYITSSKKLIKSLELIAPFSDKEVEITKSGTGFQTQYTVKEV